MGTGIGHEPDRVRFGRVKISGFDQTGFNQETVVHLDLKLFIRAKAIRLVGVHRIGVQHTHGFALDVPQGHARGRGVVAPRVNEVGARGADLNPVMTGLKGQPFDIIGIHGDLIEMFG